MKQYIKAALTAVFLTLPLADANATTFLPPSGVSAYRIAFVTEGQHDALSSNIADYNSFVTSEAAGSGIETTLSEIGANPSWYVWGSTLTVDAIDNINSGGVADIPIYNTAGQLIASGWSQFYLNKPFFNFMDFDQNGVTPTINQVWTGTTIFGTSGGACLGCGFVSGGGAANLLPSNWTSSFSGTSPDSQLSFYAFSSPIEMAPVPIPAALPLLLSGLSALGLMGWRSRSGAKPLLKSS